MMDSITSTSAETPREATLPNEGHGETIFVVNKSGDILYVHPDKGSVFGYDSAGLLSGGNLSLLFREEFQNLQSRCASQATGFSEQSVWTQTGKEIRLDITLMDFLDLNEPLLIVCREPGGNPFTVRKSSSLSATNVDALEYSRRLQERLDEERGALAAELHDFVGGYLSSLLLLLSMPMDADESWKERQTKAVETLGLLIDRTRSVSRRLRPPALDDLGLSAALESLTLKYTEDTGILIEIINSVPEGMRFEGHIEKTAFRLINEALSNVALHAKAPSLRLFLSSDSERLRIEIEDEGEGFDVSSLRRSDTFSGISEMQGQVALVGGQILIDSEPGRGTRVSFELPLGYLW